LNSNSAQQTGWGNKGRRSDPAWQGPSPPGLRAARDVPGLRGWLEAERFGASEQRSRTVRRTSALGLPGHAPVDFTYTSRRPSHRGWIWSSVDSTRSPRSSCAVASIARFRHRIS